MNVKSMVVLAPLTLLAACGGSDEGKRSEAPASTTTPQVTATTTAAVDTAPPAFAICRSCHSVEAGRNGVGPTLHGILGSKAGDVAGFPFSPALRQSGITWDRQSLDTWLQGPMKMVPGTRMVISVPDPVKREAIIDYLEKQK